MTYYFGVTCVRVFFFYVLVPFCGVMVSIPGT